MHTSRVRTGDFTHLAILQYPVRCRACLERKYVNLFSALSLRRAQKDRRRLEDNSENDSQTAA
jgi:hypothetical protein